MEVDSGAGSYAPRRRQAYASKRLQQVVSDFRKERAKVQGRQAGSPAPSQDGDFAPEDEVGPSKKRRKTTASNKRKRGLKRTDGDQAEKIRQKGANAKRKDAAAGITTSTEEESMDDADGLAGQIPSRPLGVQLRPRPEPKKKMDVARAEDSSSTDQLVE